MFASSRRSASRATVAVSHHYRPAVPVAFAAEEQRPLARRAITHRWNGSVRNWMMAYKGLSTTLLLVRFAGFRVLMLAFATARFDRLAGVRLLLMRPQQRMTFLRRQLRAYRRHLDA